MDWIDVGQDMEQWSALVNFRVPKYAWKFLNSCTIGSFSRRAQVRELVSGRNVRDFCLFTAEKTCEPTGINCDPLQRLTCRS
jgi:hypothetical protein